MASGMRMLALFENHRNHLKPLSFLLGVYLIVCTVGFYKLRDVNTDSEIQHIITIAMKADNPQMFSRDYFFGYDVHRHYIPAYLALYNFAKSITGDYQSAAYLVMAPLIFLYLLFMYNLVYDFCGDPWVSTLVCIISLPQIFALYDTWGFISHEGEIVLLARMVFTVFLPLLILALFRWRNQPKFVPVFFFLLGLLTNVHPIYGFTLLQILVLTLYLDKNSRFNVKRLVAAVAFWLLGAFPYVVVYLMMKNSTSWWSYQEMIGFLNFRAGQVLVIPPWKPFWTLFLRHSGLLILAAVAGMYIGLKDSSDNARFGVLFILSALVVGILGQWLFFQASKILDRDVVNIAQPRAVRNIYPFLFLFVSLSLVYLKKHIRGLRSSIIVGAAVLVIMTPYAMPKPAKDVLKQFFNMSTPQFNKEEYLSLVKKVKVSVPEDSLLLIDPRFNSFRGLTGKSVVVIHKDGAFARQIGRDMAQQWMERYQEVDAVYRNPSQEGLLKIALKYEADYIVTEDFDLRLPLVFASGPYQVYKVTERFSSPEVDARIRAS